MAILKSLKISTPQKGWHVIEATVVSNSQLGSEIDNIVTYLDNSGYYSGSRSGVLTSNFRDRLDFTVHRGYLSTSKIKELLTSFTTFSRFHTWDGEPVCYSTDEGSPRHSLENDDSLF